MPIEFECHVCSRSLRVPDGSEGKPCKCPGCGERLTIPFELVELVDDADVSLRIDVPCPKCKSVLNCDSSLEGTRGCCPSCAHVFTITSNPQEANSSASLDSFPFACPKCKEMFEGTADKEGKKGKCTKCSEVFVITRYVPPAVEKKKAKKFDNPKPRPATPLVAKPVVVPVKAVPVPVHVPTVVAIPVAQAQPQLPDPLSDLSAFLPTAAPSYSVPAYNPAPVVPAKKTYPSKSRGKSGGSSLGIILGILGACGGIVFLLCAGFLGFAFFQTLRTETLTVANYSVVAPGRPGKPIRPQPNLNISMAVNMTTRSEYSIAVSTAPEASRVTPEMCIEGMRLTGRMQKGNVSDVSRAGLSGKRWEALDGSMIVEIYKIPNTIMIVAYENGTHIHEQLGKKMRLTREAAKERDNPDSFFESLRSNQ